MALTKAHFRMIEGSAVNVKDFGAVGDGVTDDTAAIQAAIDYSDSLGGTRIIFPKGRYLVSSTLNITNDFYIQGIGKDSIVLVDSSLGASNDIVYIKGAGAGELRNCYLKDMAFAPVSGTPGRHCIHLDLTDPSKLAADVVFDHVFTEEFGGYAFYLTNPTKTDGFFASSFEKCKLKGGLYMQRAGDALRVSECNISGSKEGLRISGISGASQVILENNLITAAGGAIYIEDYVEQLKIVNNQIEQSSTYTGDLPSGSTACIAILGSAAYSNDLTEISQNNINNFGNVDYCITLDYTNGCKVSGNVLGAKTQVGFETDHIKINSNSKNTRMFRDNIYLSIDTTTDTEPRFTDNGIGTAGLIKPLTAFYNGWSEADSVNYPVTVYKCPASNIVHLQGKVTGGTTTSGTKILDIPQGYNPESSHQVNCPSQSSGGTYSSTGVLQVIKGVTTGSLLTRIADANMFVNAQYVAKNA